MSKIPIDFAFDIKYALPASIAIQSLLDSKDKNTEYDIFVLHSGLKTYIKNKFSKITNIKWIEVPRGSFNGFPESDNWNELVYYRLLIPELIPEYDKIIYSDIDVFFQKDLSDVYNTNIDNYYWGGVIAERNIPETSCHKYFPENKNEYIYMSGFMLINSRKWIKDKIEEQLFSNANIFKDRLRFFDLDLLNITCNKILELPFEYCMLENIYEDVTGAKEFPWLNKVYSLDSLTKAKNDPAIIHYAGKNPKIWLRNRSLIPSYYWEYIESSPFYDKDFYYPPKFKSLLITILCRIAEICCPIKHCRKKLREKRKTIEYHQKI